MDMDEKQIAIIYIDILRRSNCNSLMLVLNSYWAHSAFELGPLDYPKVLDCTERIRTNAESILKICQAQPRDLSRHRQDQKRSHPDNSIPNAKKKKMSNESNCDMISD